MSEQPSKMEEEEMKDEAPEASASSKVGEEKDLDQKVFKQIKVLEKTISGFKNDINLKQPSYFNDIVINGVPEVLPLKSSLINLAQKLRIKVKGRDVIYIKRVSFFRVPKVQMPVPSKSPAEGEEAPPVVYVSRPRPIIVRFARRALVSALLQAYRNTPGLTAGKLWPGMIDFAITICERLNKKKRRIYRRLRFYTRQAKWSELWVNKGRIYARKTKNDTRIEFRNDRDINAVFGSGSQTSPRIN